MPATGCFNNGWIHPVAGMARSYRNPGPHSANSA
jgi:hypothetical protein